MPDYEVVTELSFVVQSEDSLEEAVEFVHDGVYAVLETRGGDMFDSKLAVESCPHCNNENIRASFVAGTALVGVELSVTIFDAEDERYAERVVEAKLDEVIERDFTHEHILTEEIGG